MHHASNHSQWERLTAAAAQAEKVRFSLQARKAMCNQSTLSSFPESKFEKYKREASIDLDLESVFYQAHSQQQYPSNSVSVSQSTNFKPRIMKPSVALMDPSKGLTAPGGGFPPTVAANEYNSNSFPVSSMGGISSNSNLSYDGLYILCPRQKSAK